MVYTPTNRRLRVALALGFAVAGALVFPTPSAAQQERFQVLVPRLERQGDIDEDFGEDVAKELRELIEQLPTHTPVDEDDFEDALDVFHLDKDELTCVQARQLAARQGYQLVMCGTYAATAGGMEVTAQFISARDQVTFNAPAVTATEPEQAAQEIFSSFKDYVNLISLVAYCSQDLANEMWEPALERCEKALAIDSVFPSALYGKGYALMKMGRLDAALEPLEKVLALNPANADALNAAGFITAKLERNDESRAYYRRYLELNPGNVQVRLTIATEAANAGDPEGALQIAEEGMTGDSVDLTLLEYAGYFAVNAAAERMQPPAGQDSGTKALSPEAAALYEKALGYFDQVITAKGDSTPVNVWAQKLSALTSLERTAEAIQFGAEAVAAHPDNVSLWSSYASALKDGGRVDEALAALDSVLARDAEAQNIRALQGQWLVQSGALSRAAEAFRLAVDRGEIGSNAAALAILGAGFNQKFEQKLYDEALPYFESALEFATDANTQSMANFFIGFVLLDRGRRVQEPSTAASAKEALPIFQRALEHLEKGRAYGVENQGANYQKFIDNANQFIEIQTLLIKAG